MSTRDSLVRNLDQIQEAEKESRGARIGTLVLTSLGGACLVFAAIAQVRRPSAAPVKPVDPLGDLVSKAHAAAPAIASAELSHDVTFPGMLSDSANPTTALAVVNARNVAPIPPASAPFAVPPGAPTVPPVAADRLPVTPLPAGNVASPSPVVTRPRDGLTMLAAEASSTTSATMADEGHAGQYQLQASSFRNEAEAQAFATALRQRGHRAYVEAAAVPGRGTWFRVRIGPFKSRAEAARYRSEFEKKEHLAPFLVEPPREKPVKKG